MDKIRVAVIGNGIIGEEHIRNYKNIKDCEITAICDINEERLNYIGDKYDIKKRFTHIGKMLLEDDIDAADICLHNNLHAPVTNAVLNSGRHAYCEKPMAGAYADALSMYETAQKVGKKLHIQLALLYEDAAKASKILIDNGYLGKIYHVRSCGFRRRGRPFVDGYATKEFVNSHTARGGALFDMGVYRMSQLLYLTGLPKLERVVGKVYQEVEVDEKRKTESGFDVEELGTGYAVYENNISLDVIESWAIHMGGVGRSMIAGDKGGLMFDPLSYHTLKEDLQIDQTIDLGAMNYRNHTVHAENSMYDSSQIHWINVLLGRCEQIPTAKIALETSLLQEGIFLSSNLGRELTANEVKSLTKSTAIYVPNIEL
ncbi:MAG: Gfo/Idh/MocA family oxidoreductase [Oscillospiraceae bacterium]|nr:Gfo/Idh/MocA family oxidoreductase [Oscillospiraceae bacterium]